MPIPLPDHDLQLDRLHGRALASYHVVLLAGWDAANQAYVFVDSAQRHAPTHMPRAEFLRLWRNMGRLLVETR
mgnify:CR=1 FL=1